MTDALTSLDMSTGLRKVAERAKREPAGRFHSLAHLIDVELLAGAFARLRNDAAVGVDGITKEHYGQELESKLKDLHERLRTKRYRHQPIQRVHIPKEKGRTRPIGISTIEDKVVQNALRHSTASHPLRSGVDINTIRGWLGHVSLDTTHIYAEIDLETKARALATCAV